MGDASNVVKGDGYAVANLDDLGEGYGFRKIRRDLDVKAFGMDERDRDSARVRDWTALPRRAGGDVLRPSRHDRDGLWRQRDADARVDAATVRSIKNVGEEDAVYVIVGGKDGYVGRDGRLPEGETRR